LPLIAVEAASHTIEGQVKPYNTYRFWVSCCFSPVCDSEGPSAYTEVVTQEKGKFKVINLFFALPANKVSLTNYR